LPPAEPLPAVRGPVRPAGAGRGAAVRRVTVRVRARLLVAGSWLAFLVTENLLWVRRTLLPAPPPWDPALYLFMSLRYWHALAEPGLGALWREIQARNLVPYVPPLFPLSALPLYAVFGESRLAAYATSSAYLGILLAGTALLARGRAGAPLLALFLA